MLKNVVIISLTVALVTIVITIYSAYTAEERQIVSLVNKISLDQKIGQMLIIGIENKYLDDQARQMIEQYHVGGINLLGRNIENKDQTKRLVADLQKISAVPLFIATDQEGGEVIRFRFLKELIPQIKIKDTEQAGRIAFDRARELQEIGINMNFSPVLDYTPNNRSYIYNRTFGANPDSIGDLGNAMIKGYISGGVIPVAKHFPGYGNVSIDPHTNQAVLAIEQKELESNLIPFQRVVANNNSTFAIMTAHVVIPVIDTKPATISSKFITEILRERLKFKGVIITDDMEMVSAGSSVEQSSVDAIKAGADMIISTYTPEKQIEIFNRLKNTVLNGEIAEERINESVMRIMRLKSTLKN